jgi:hypothetical protein
MKILKSGIEMTPSDLSKIKGGACACGCGINWNGTELNFYGDDGELCCCACGNKPYDLVNMNSFGARRVIYPPGI